MNTNTSFCVDDEESGNNDSVAALEALMTIKRASIDFSDPASTKQGSDTMKAGLESTPIMSNKRQREFYLPSVTTDHPTTGIPTAPLHLAGTVLVQKERTPKPWPTAHIDSSRTHPPIQDGHNPSDTKPHSHSKSVFPSSSQTTTTPSTLVPTIHILKATPEAALSVADNDDGTSSFEDPFIHSEKIEAALKSKPQRGKKRENLNALERLELTRTRNREHAKSTRIRKKARYEELMDRENMYFQHEREKERDEARRRNLVLFMDLRSKLFLKPESSSSFQDNDEGENRSLSSSSRIVSSVNLLPEEQSSPSMISNKMDPNHVSCFQDILDNIHQFKFDHDRNEAHAYQGLQAMEFVDRTMMPRFQLTTSSLKDVNASSLLYRIVGGAQGIGINQQGSAYAEFELVCSQKPNPNHALGDGERTTTRDAATHLKDCILLSGMLQAEFSNESDKIVSVKIFSISEKSTAVNREVDPKALHNGYPSVVSLDHPTSQSMSHGVESTNNNTGHNDDCQKHDVENTCGGESDFFII